MSDVKRFAVPGRYLVAGGKNPGAQDVVLATDYAALEAECERLRADMRFLAEYIAVESTGHPLPNYLAVGRFPVDVARAALSAKP